MLGRMEAYQWVLAIGFTWLLGGLAYAVWKGWREDRDDRG